MLTHNDAAKRLHLRIVERIVRCGISKAEAAELLTQDLADFDDLREIGEYVEAVVTMWREKDPQTRMVLDARFNPCDALSQRYPKFHLNVYAGRMGRDELRYPHPHGASDILYDKLFRGLPFLCVDYYVGQTNLAPAALNSNVQLRTFRNSTLDSLTAYAFAQYLLENEMAVRYQGSLCAPDLNWSGMIEQEMIEVTRNASGRHIEVALYDRETESSHVFLVKQL